MFSARVHIQYVSQSPVKIYSATNIKLYMSSAAVHVCVHGHVLTLKLVFSVQGLLLVFPRQSLSSAFQRARLVSHPNRCLTVCLLWLVLVAAFVPVFHCGSHHEVISENSPGRLLHGSDLCTSTHTEKHQDKHTDSRGTEPNKHLSTHSILFGLARCSDASVFPPQHIDEVFLWDRTKDLCLLPVWSTSVIHFFLHSFLVFPHSVEQLNHPSEGRRTTLEQMLGYIYVKQRHKANRVVTL